MVSFPRVSLPKPCTRFSHPSYKLVLHPSHSFRIYHPNTGREVQIIKLLIMQFSPLPCHFVPLRPKYCPQHPLLKHLQPTFLPQTVGKFSLWLSSLNQSHVLNTRPELTIVYNTFVRENVCYRFTLLHVKLYKIKPVVWAVAERYV